MTQFKYTYLLYLIMTMYANGIALGHAEGRRDKSTEYLHAKDRALECLDYIRKALEEELSNDTGKGK